MKRRKKRDMRIVAKGYVKKMPKQIAAPMDFTGFQRLRGLMSLTRSTRTIESLRTKETHVQACTDFKMFDILLRKD
uniref:Uncharacterized protein n=1 Tax=Octopus bimaculoides TaxID=37653 RepID=A0A0L8I784_OCTBM